ncbi:NAD(P)H-hydrate epimerase [Halobellus sp. EA9]|uniref:NAD(P)H-hydrate epimerase n=1 Tax=Halobellus sp. EA9 TaxID=3421647 RepID=UPI003EC10145
MEFRTDDGRIVPAVTAEEMRAVDRVAVEDVGLELLQMMENAGRALASHVFEARSAPDAPVEILAGNGGNGGGGMVCARHLANNGVPITVVLDRDPDTLSGAAAHQHRILDEMAVPVRNGAEERGDPAESGVLVDALIGYGLSGPVRGTARELIERTARSPAPVVSLDVPSGVDASDGHKEGPPVSPDRTVTLALPKTGLRDVEGSLFLADIGVPRTVYDRMDIDYRPPFDGRPSVELHRNPGG